MIKKLTSRLIIALFVCFSLTTIVPLVFATPPRTGQLYYDGNVVRTLVPSNKPLKNPGIDPLYAFPEGVEGQYSVTQYAPGDKEYRGGHWAVWIVSWNVDPYLITSYAGIQAAISAGDISVARNEAADVLCPVLPGKPTW
jgi:hypothetical protein